MHFKIWSRSIFNLEYSSRLLKVQDYKVLIVHYVKAKMSKQQQQLSVKDVIITSIILRGQRGIEIVNFFV